MDRDMIIDTDSAMDVSTGFIFSSPNMIPTSEKSDNYGSYADNIFGNRPTPFSESSSYFTFAKPVNIDQKDGADQTNLVDMQSVIKNKSPFLSHEIKKTTSFTQLEKNAKKRPDVKLEFSKSITCSDVPDSLLVKSVAKEYFEQFGEILKITVRPRRKTITVYYSTKDSASAAFYESGFYKDQKLRIEWTTPDMLLKQKLKEITKDKMSSILCMDEDVKEEIEALRDLEYNLPDLQNFRSSSVPTKANVKKPKVMTNRETLKRIVPLLTKPTMKSAKQAPSMDKSQSKLELSGANQKIKTLCTASIEELQSQVRQAGTTSEERYKILDARDRLMRLKHEKQKNLATAKVTKGTCPDMCPEKERYMREFQRQISSYEQLEDSDYKINDSAAIKQYSRSSADQEEPMAHDLRPVKSLMMTMSYLLHEIADLDEDEGTNLAEWYHFLWDRMRSIRKDITQQELCCPDSVELVEQCARFHILTSERLCAEEVSVFDPKINSENLTKCLQTLKYMYYDLRESGVCCKNESEFRAYIILLNLNNGTFISELSTLTPAIQHSQEVKFALDIYSALAMDNYSRFFKLVRKTTYLNGCILMRYFNQVRIKALSIMIKAYCRTSGTTEYPLYELIDILGFEDEDEVFDFCVRTGLKCDKESLYIKLNRDSFRAPDCNIEQGRAYTLVLSKRLLLEQSVGQCIAGGTWPEKSYESHKPHCSFDDQGYLLPSSINAQDQSLVDSGYIVDEDEQLASEQKVSIFENKGPADTYDKSQENDKFPNFRTTSADQSDVKAKSKPVFLVPQTSGKRTREVPSSTTMRTTRTTTTTMTTTMTMTTTTTTTTTSSSSSSGSGSGGTYKRTEADSTIFASTLTNNGSSIFSRPSSSIFASTSTKSSSIFPTNSPFSVTSDKSIFAGRSHANVFKQPTQPPALQPPAQSLNKDSGGIASRDRMPMKRRLEDQESSAEKKSLLEAKLETRKGQADEPTTEERERSDRERQRRLERVAERSIGEYEKLEREVTGEICSEVARAEVERTRLFEALAERIWEGLVKELCEAVLDEQLFFQDMLIELERRERDRLLAKYGKIWRERSARRRAQRREALDNTPVWLQPESLEGRARKLYQPQQRAAIAHARESRKRKPCVVAPGGPARRTPIEFIVSVGLKENARNLRTEPSQRTFWKMVISWPVLENRLTLWRHKKLFNGYLSPADPGLEPIFIQHKCGEQEQLDICIRYFEGLVCENCLTGTDGLLLIAGSDEELRTIERRLTKTVLSREKLMPIPLVILVFGEVEHELGSAAEGLLEAGYLSKYTVLCERSHDEAVVLRVLQSATLWLAINRSPRVPLEMDHLKRLLDDCFTEDLWMRIHDYLEPNQQFAEALNEPNFIIGLHNEAVNGLLDIVMDPESLNYTDFAPELKIYLDNKESYPCTYEHFDNAWKHSEYRAELERLISSFVLPPWREAWPPGDPTELHDAIARYCQQIVSYEQSLAIAKNIMSDLYLVPGSTAEDTCPSVADVVIHLVAKKISDLGGSARVVYNKSHVKCFQTLPWWFKSRTLHEYADQQRQQQQHQQQQQQQQQRADPRDREEENNRGDCEKGPERVRRVLEEAVNATTKHRTTDLEYDIVELSETWHQRDEEMTLVNYCEETRSRVANVQGTVAKLEKRLEEQRLKSQALEAKLRQALEDEEVPQVES